MLGLKLNYVSNRGNFIYVYTHVMNFTETISLIVYFLLIYMNYLIVVTIRS